MSVSLLSANSVKLQIFLLFLVLVLNTFTFSFKFSKKSFLLKLKT